MGSIEEALKIASYRHARPVTPSREGPVPALPLRGRITDRDRSEFCTQLAVMLEARVPLLRSIEVLALQARNAKMKRVIEAVGMDIRKGASFDRALGAHPEVFGNLFVVTCEVGQESGRLSQVLSHLAVHLEKMDGLGRKIRQALAYPVLVLSVAVLAVTFLMLFVVPTFAEMFESFQIELPASTRAILMVNRLMEEYGGYLLAGLGAMIWGMFMAARNPLVKARVMRLWLRAPVLGGIVVKAHVARFCRTLGTLLEAQVSLVEALMVTSRITTNANLRHEIEHIASEVQKGHAIAHPLEGSPIFPPMVVQMVAVGEETSKLDAMLLKVADYYEREIDASVELLSTIIEPAIILFLGLVVAGILIAMYLPMFDLVQVSAVS